MPDGLRQVQGILENWSSKSYSCDTGSLSQDLRTPDLQVVV